MEKISESDVIAAIEKALKLKPNSLPADASATDIETWDSLGQLNILVSLDTLFDGKVANIQEMAEANTLPKILSLLKKHTLL